MPNLVIDLERYGFPVWAKELDQAGKAIRKETAKLETARGVLPFRTAFHQLVEQFRGMRDRLDAMAGSLENTPKIQDPEPLSAGLSERPTGSIIGMTWQEAQPKAEEFVRTNGFPGKTELARQVGCDPRTLGRAIKESKTLKAAEEAYNADNVPKPRVVTLTDKVLLKEESKSVEPSDEAAINEILSQIPRSDMIARITEWTQVLNSSATGEGGKTDELIGALEKCEDRKLATVYLTVKQQVDESKADDPKKPRRRKGL